MAKRRIKFSDQLRHAIETCGMTRYEISKRTGVAQPTLSRFMYGKGGLSVDGLDKIADCLGLNLAADKPSPKKGK